MLFFNAVDASESELTGLLVGRAVTRQAVRAGWGLWHGDSYKLVNFTENMVDVKVTVGGGRSGRGGIASGSGGGMTSGGGGDGGGQAGVQTGAVTSSPSPSLRPLPRRGKWWLLRYGLVETSAWRTARRR